MANITKIYDIKLQGEKALVDRMKGVNKEFDDAKKKFKELKEIVSKGGLSAGEMAKYKLEMQQAKLETERLRQETLRLNNEGKALSNTTRIQREEEKKKRQESGLTLDAYQKLSRELNEMRKNAKALGVEFGEDSEQFRKATLEANRLDAQLKRIDASLGQFQRNVGNYPKEINIGGVSSGVLNQLKNAGIDDILGNQVDRTKGKVIQLNSEFKELKDKLDQAKTSGVADLNALETEIIQNRIAADNLNKEIVSSQNHLNGLGSVGSGVFGKMGSDVKSMILGYVGLQAAMSGVQEMIRNTKELSDQTTNLEIELEKTAGGARELVDGLAGLDTRSKLIVLEEIANIATKAGTSEENLLAVTAAIDKIKVSFGKDFGDVETGTETFAKLINIFYEDREITGDRILKIGNSIRTLANETVASVPFITDFNGRMAGLKQTFSNLELSQTIGLGAGFEEFKQSAEVSSTALVKILPKLAADTEKFAKILGIPQKEFSKLINDNPVEALLQVSEKLVKTQGGVEGIANSFADAELGAGRVTTILGTMGGKADVFRARIKRAGETINDTTNIEEAFRKKNENLAGTLDKISKKFSDMANNKNFVKLISTTGTVVLGLITIIGSIPFGWWIAMISILTLAYWDNIRAMSGSIAATWAKITVKTQEILLNAIGNALLITGTALEYGQAAATRILTGAKWLLVASLNAVGISSGVVQRAMMFLNSTFLATPIGWLVIGLLAVAAVTKSYAQEIDNTSTKLKGQAKAIRETAESLKVNAELQNEIKNKTAETKDTVAQLLSVLRDKNATHKEEEEALKRLKEVGGSYLEGLTMQNVLTAEGTALIARYIKALDNLADAEARVALRKKLNNQKLESENKITALKAEKKSAGEGNLLERGLGEDGKFFGVELSRTKASIQGDIENEKNNLNQLNKQYDAISNSNAQRIEKLRKAIAAGNTKLAQMKKGSTEALKLEQDVINNQKALDILLGLSSETGGDYNPNGKDDDDKASKLSGAQKDYLRDINALREAELSELKKAKLSGEISEENYLKKSLAVNIKYNDKILDHFKGTDAVTRKLRADTASDTIDKKIETNEKLFKLQEEELTQTLETEKAKAQAKLDDVNSDPYSTDVDKAKAEEEFYSTILNLQVDYNSKMDALEREFSLQSKKNSQDRKNLILKEEADLVKKRYALTAAQFKAVIDGVSDFEEYRKNNAEIEASKKRMGVLNDKSLTQKQKEHELDKINAALNLANINIELGAVNAKIALNEKEFETKRRTNEQQKEYNRLLKEKQLLEERKGVAQNEVKIKAAVEIELPSASSLQDQIKALIAGTDGKLIIGQDENGEGGFDATNMLGSVIAQSFDIAQQAMNNYFEAEKIGVENSKKLAYERIDLEKRQLLARAQSEAERQNIEKQAAAKKAQADKEAGEKLKKIKKNEAKIAFMMELANIWSTVFQLGPIAGIIMGAVLSGLAVARYANTTKAINQTQYAKGGKFGLGGKLSGPSHSENNGMPVINPVTGETQAYMEGDEGIINKNSMNDKSVYTVSGTPSQIASRINAIGGGVDWNGGATLTKFMNGGQYLGSSVKPPIFRSYYENVSQSSSADFDQYNERMDRIEKNLEATAQNLAREVTRKTVISTREFSNAKDDYDKQTEIATL